MWHIRRNRPNHQTLVLVFLLQLLLYYFAYKVKTNAYGGRKAMEINLRILKALPILFLCFSLFTSSTAQTPDEQLPDIIKKIKPSVVTVLTYNAEGKLLKLGTGFVVSLAGDINN